MSAIEVYPHPALLKLLSRDYRVPYKTGKSTKYWKGISLAERRRLLIHELREIYRALAGEFGGLPFELPSDGYTGTLSHLKRFEDALDALVCAWVGKQHLLGRTTPYGDEDSTIWVPNGHQCSPTS